MISALDPENGRDDEAEKLIQPFATKGFKFFNQIVFVSRDSIKVISDHIVKLKSEKFQFFLIDMTDNFEKQSFFGALSTKHFPIAAEASKIMSVFKPVLPELDDKQKADALFDKIAKDGMDSLTQKEKMFLDAFSKSKKQY